MAVEQSARGAREIVRFLGDHGHRHLFALPGSSMVAALHELQLTDIDYVPAIHESVAVAAADGYARVAGSAVVMLYMLHGLANGLANLYNAWRDETSLIVIASQQASVHRTPGWTVGEGDMVALARPYTRLSHELTSGMSVRTWLESAYRASTGPVPGPSFLSMTEDVFELPGPVASLRSSVRATPNMPDAALVANVLASAERPLIVVGGQLRRCGGSEIIERLALAYGIAIVYESGFNDRLGVAPGHPNVLGSIGANGIPAEQTADVVLLLGARAMLEAHPRPRWFPSANFIAHVNADPAKLEETLTADWSCACDPGMFATALENALEALPLSSMRLAARENAIRTMRESPVTGPLADILKPYARAVSALKDALDRGWLVDEAVMGSVALLGGLRSRDGHRYIGTTGAALGWGTGAAAGVALASGEPVSCVIGDGALRFGALGLWTIRARNLPITIVVLDNGGYGSTRYYERQYINRLGPDAAPPHPGYNGSDLRNTGSTVGGIIQGFGIHCRTLNPEEDPREAICDAWSRSSEGPNAVVIPLGFES